MGKLFAVQRNGCSCAVVACTLKCGDGVQEVVLSSHRDLELLCWPPKPVGEELSKTSTNVKGNLWRQIARLTLDTCNFISLVSGHKVSLASLGGKRNLVVCTLYKLSNFPDDRVEGVATFDRYSANVTAILQLSEGFGNVAFLLEGSNLHCRLSGNRASCDLRSEGSLCSCSS